MHRLEVEGIVAKEAFHLVTNQPKHIKTIAGLYLFSLAGGDKGTAMRVSVIPMRKVDDRLDGDVFSENPLAHALYIRSQLQTGSFDCDTPDSIMLKASLEILEAKSKPEDNPRQDFIDLVDAMIFDLERQDERKVLTFSELEDYYKGTFDTWINIMLLAIDSDLRSKDIPALSYGQGRIYSVRDLRVDWGRGVINIPQEILEEAKVSPHCSFDELVSNKQVLYWLNHSVSLTKLDLVDLRKQLKDHGDKLTYLTCNKFISSMLKLDVSEALSERSNSWYRLRL